MTMYRVDVEYKCSRTVYIEAESKADARLQAKDTRNWIDALDPQEIWDSYVAKKAEVER